MAFYPDVVPGTTFVPIASLENQVRRNINALNGIGGSAIKDKSLSTVRIRVYNNTELTLPAGTAVGFILSSALVGDAVPAEAVKDISKPWGVLADSLKPNDIGYCIISGPVTVDCTGTGAFAEPDVSTPSVFKLGGSGAPVLFSADGRALINLGASSGGSAEYNGYFKLVDASDETGLKVKVVDGFSEDLSIETKAGVCILNDDQHELDVKTLPITGNCFIYLESDYNTTTKTSSKPVINQYADKKEAEANKSYFLLYRVRFMDGVITRISREFYGVPQMFMWGSCDD